MAFFGVWIGLLSLLAIKLAAGQSRLDAHEFDALMTVYDTLTLPTDHFPRFNVNEDCRYDKQLPPATNNNVSFGQASNVPLLCENGKVVHL